jgi:hypothetical protein
MEIRSESSHLRLMNEAKNEMGERSLRREAIIAVAHTGTASSFVSPLVLGPRLPLFVFVFLYVARSSLSMALEMDLFTCYNDQGSSKISSSDF